MDNAVITTITSIVLDMLDTIMLFASAVVVYLAFQQAALKQWLGKIGTLGKVILFIIAVDLLARTAYRITWDIITLTDAFNYPDQGLTASVQCLSGVAALAIFAVGSFLLVRKSKQDE